MITVNRFCVNRKAAPKIYLKDTVTLLNGLGIQHLEVRNDLGTSVDNAMILDDIDGVKANKIFGDNNVSVETINAVGNMDLRSNVDDNIRSLTEMLDVTKNINLKNIIFCPARLSNDSRTLSQVKSETIANLKEYEKVLDKYGVAGLIEPLGFIDSTLRFPWDCQNVIQESGVTNFKLVADTFHYYLAGIDTEKFNSKVDVSCIGLVHLSSVLKNKPRDLMDDQDRYMLNDSDVMESIKIAHMIEDAGYSGLYSFEPFSVDLKQYSKQQIRDEILNSVNIAQNNI